MLPSTVGRRFIEWAGDDLRNKIPDVEVKVKIYRIMNLESTEGTYQVDACIMLDWVDESLGERPEPTVDGFLLDLGLEKHASAFAKNGITTMDDVYNLDKQDLKDLGVDAIVERNRLLSAAEDANWDSLNWDDHFRPAIEVTNAIPGEGDYDPTNLPNPKWKKAKAGKQEKYRCSLTVKWQMTLRARLDFHQFPFDDQVLEISIKSMSCRGYDQSVQTVLSEKGQEIALVHPRFRGAKGHEIGEHADYLAEFHILYLAAATHNNDKERKKVDDEYTLQIHTKRDSSSVMYNVAFCMFVIDCLTFTAHGIPIGDLADRLSVNLTLLLTTMAFKWYLNENLPNIPYLTVMEQYVVASFTQFLLQGILFWGLAEAENYRCADDYIDYFSGEKRVFDSNSTDTRILTCKSVHYADRVVLVLLLFILFVKNGWFLWKYKYINEDKLNEIRTKAEQAKEFETNYKKLDLEEFQTHPVKCPNNLTKSQSSNSLSSATVSSKYVPDALSAEDTKVN